jgi:hypothetical protein
MHRLIVLVTGVVVVGASACQSPRPLAAPTPKAKYDQLSRIEFNRWAVRENVPLFWIADSNHDNAISRDEVTELLLYGPPKNYLTPTSFGPDWAPTYARLVAASKHHDELTSPEMKRHALVEKELDQGYPALIYNDLSGLADGDKRFVAHMLRAGELVDALYERHNGAAALRSKLPADAASQSMFRRNHGPRCVAPSTANEPLCSAIPGSPKPTIDVYPPELQTTEQWCQALPESVMSPFTAVRMKDGQLITVPFTEAYPAEMNAIAAELSAAADSITDASEGALVAYLRAASTAFRTNDWVPADEAWAKMTVDNSKWYVRAQPDEVDWEPCHAKAGLHLILARIDQPARALSRKLVPVEQDMEVAIAKAAGPPYVERKMTLQLPAIVDVVLNAGEARLPFRASVGQTLPNWGPVVDEGRTRSIAVVNVDRNPDTIEFRHHKAASVLDASSMTRFVDTAELGVLALFVNEISHKFGPSLTYKVNGKTNEDLFGPSLAWLVEHLKAQAATLYLFELLRSKQIIDDELAAQSYADGVVWALELVSRGLHTRSGQQKSAPTAGAILIGFLIEQGALTWDPQQRAANGQDVGAFVIHYEKMAPAVEALTKLVAGIQARGDKAAAETIVRVYADSTIVPQAIIEERFSRMPIPSLVYAVRL